MRIRGRGGIVAGLVAAWAALGPAAAQADDAVVVELFTSQGCSSCPPADRLLARLAERDDVIALALHVDYWDYIGWADSFARPEHTVRQKAYAHAVGQRMVYTPQMIIEGQDQVVGARVMDVMELVEAHRDRPDPLAVEIDRQGGELRVVARWEAAPEAEGPYFVQLVRYRPHGEVDILRGENAGRSFSYANIVTAWDVVGKWDGAAPLELTLEISGEEPAVVIVQQAGHGPILGAAQAR
jgi:hypothetical protein